LVTSGSQVWRTVFNASFQSGNVTDYFNDSVVATCGAVDNASLTQVHNGLFAEFDYYDGGPCGENVRAYPTEQLSTPLAVFYLNIWVYVPEVKLTDWVSFITLHLTDDTFITVDSNMQRQLHLWSKITGNTFQIAPVAWPFDKWFQIGILGRLQPGTTNSTIIVYQNGTPIITFTGDTGNGLLGRMHFGLYTGPEQWTFSVYNDDITLMTPDAEFDHV